MGYQFALEIQQEYRTHHENFEPTNDTLRTGDMGVHSEGKFVYNLYNGFEMCSEEVHGKSTRN